jgi:hypothetical protein
MGELREAIAIAFQTAGASGSKVHEEALATLTMVCPPNEGPPPLAPALEAHRHCMQWDGGWMAVNILLRIDGERPLTLAPLM